MGLRERTVLSPGRRACPGRRRTKGKCFGWAAALGCAAVLTLSGCGHVKVPETVSRTTLVADQSGALTYYLVGYFEKEYYDPAELMLLAEEEVLAFRESKDGEGTGGVSLEKVELLQDTADQVAVVYRFDGSESFSEFTGSSLFYGTVNEALVGGFDPGDGLISVKDGISKTEEELKEDGEKHLIITDVRALVYCPTGVLALSGGAALTGDGSVDTREAQEEVWILF
ncbi:MAG: hypothetical protein NC541_01105 [bacterium]|nr:hypothetical protein [bacterium]